MARAKFSVIHAPDRPEQSLRLDPALAEAG